MFKKLAKQLTQELDSDGKLIPVSSLAQNDGFQLLSLVTKKPSRWPWNSRKYSPISFKLTDVLQEEAIMEIELKHSEPLLFSANTCHKSGGRLNFKIQSTEVDVGGLAVACLNASPVHLRKTYVDPGELWKRDLSLSVVQQNYPKLHNQMHNLYIVTEVLVITEPFLIDETVQAGGKGEVSAVNILKIQGQHKTMKNKSMLIPFGTVMAYGVEKLQICEEDPGEFQTMLDHSLTYDAFQSELGSSLTAVQQVQDAVKEAYEPLLYQTQPLKKNLLESFEIFLQNRNVSTVRSMLELSMAGDNVDRSMLESLNEEFRVPVEMLLSYLGIFQDTKRGENQDLWGPMHFLCSSIDELDYEMMPLLQKMLEKKQLAKPMEMVEFTLERIISGEEGGTFTLPSHSLMEEEVDLNLDMLQICGLDLEIGENSITCQWNNDACSELAALYSSLYALQILSG
ncbi:gasdermin-D-like [Pantherophis guttatus]|uniref:Gasdermin-D-like n=1 Tax=Pantherophis guttatus TaxID=94885 RepID=A0A6P9BKC9_PANGU|nr:gasdermin-D-like [Pantherophis guttatus]